MNEIETRTIKQVYEAILGLLEVTAAQQVQLCELHRTVKELNDRIVDLNDRVRNLEGQ